MNTLLIEKQTGGYFKFTLNGDTANAITSINNDLLAVGNQLHFKTGNGANIIKEQFIYPADVTIVSGGTFTFTTVAQVWDKLIAIDYFAWLGGGSTGGVDRFDDLLDTFSYTGNAGKAVVVDNSELKLVPITLYNKRLFTELEDTPNSLVPDKMVVVNSTGTALIFQDQPEPPAEYLNSVGYFDYNDLATQTTPLNAVANVALKLTNDTEGANTSTDQNPYGVSYVWDYTTNQFNFSELEVGDTIDVRVHVQVTTTTSNQKVSLSAKFGIGSVAEFTNSIFETTFKTSGLHEISFVAPFYMGSTYITDYPAELYLTTDASATVKVDGWYVRILRKNINIITVDYQVEDATTTTKGIVRLAGDLAGTANNPTVPELANKVPTSRTVSTTSPLLGGGALSSNLSLSIQQSNSVDSGYLSNVDWITFNGKANDNAVVKLTGDQSIAGDKTFTTTNRTTFQNGDAAQITFKNTGDLTKTLNIGYGSNGNIISSTGLDFRVGGLTSSALLILANENATFKENLTAKSFIKSGGTSSQFLKADGSVDSTTYQTALTNPVTGTGTSGQIAYWNGTSSITGESNLFWDSTNDRLGIGTTSPASLLTISSLAPTFTINRQPTGTQPKISLTDNGSEFSYIQSSAASSIMRYDIGPSAGWGGIHAFYTDTTEKMRITSGGNVGIGTTSPSFAIGSGLHVKSNSGWGEIRIEGQSFAGGTGSVISFTSEGTTLADIYADTDKNLSFRTNGASSSMRILANGNVGIGTTNPVSKLTINTATNENVAIGSLSAITAGRTLILQTSSTGGSIETYSSITGGYVNTLINPNGGNVGIGTTSPSQKLEVSGGAAQFNGGNIDGTLGDAILFGNTTYPTVQKNRIRSSISATGANNLLVLETSTATAGTYNANQLVLKGDGNVGIGTASPGAKFHLKSTSQVSIIESSNTDLYQTYRANSVDVGYIGNGVGTVGGSAATDFGFQSAYNMVFATGGGSERMRITSGGDVGIGETNPAYKLDVKSSAFNVANFNSTYGQMAISFANSGTIFSQIGSGTSVTPTAAFDDLGFGTAGLNKNIVFATGSSYLERMRISSSGKLLIGTTTAGFGLFSEQRVTINPTNDGITVGPLTQNKSAYTLQADNNTGTRYALYMANGSGDPIGNISFTSTTTSYNTTSDYRLKQDFKSFNGLDLVSKIKVYDYAWKSDKSRMKGVIAHELQEVLPYAVTGEKDAEQMQQVDYSKLVPILVQAIQELKAEIERISEKI
jgi:hypothetical protein